MNQSSTYVSNQQKLQQLMQQAEIANFEELSQVSGVSQWQLNRLLTGLLPKLSIIGFAEKVTQKFMPLLTKNFLTN